MKKCVFIVCFMLCSMAFCQAQYTYKVDKKHVNLSLGYFSLIDLGADSKKFRHGGSLGISYSVVNKYKEKLQRRSQINRIMDRDVYLKINFTTYRREAIHNTFGVSAGPAFRITIPEGLYFEFGGQVGYMKTFLKGDQYIYEDDAISSTRALGSNLLSVQANTFIGWNFSKSNDYPASLYAGFGLLSYFPNNDKWLFQPQFQAGLIFVLIKLKERYRDYE